MRQTVLRTPSGLPAWYFFNVSIAHLAVVDIKNNISQITTYSELPYHTLVTIAFDVYFQLVGIEIRTWNLIWNTSMVFHLLVPLETGYIISIKKE